jgi:hypothetical protein
MTTEGWIFMVGFRVFDVGLLVVWLIWFFRLRDDGDDSQGEDGGGGGGNPRPSGDGPGGNGFRLPLGPARPASHRIRDHSPRHAPRRRRGPGQPVPRPLPARVRRPHAPVPVHNRA